MVTRRGPLPSRAKLPFRAFGWSCTTRRQVGGRPAHSNLTYLTAVNLLDVVTMWLGEKQAGAEGRRVPEKAILRYAAPGGAAGVLAGALAFKHKTQHKNLLAKVALASAVAHVLLLSFK